MKPARDRCLGTRLLPVASGAPNSHGCIRMRNADVAELFEMVGPGAPVMIS